MEEIRNPDPTLFNDDLRPLPKAERTWNKWHLAALWVGMAVCIPTYMLAGFMIKSGMHWTAAIAIIALANVLITLPMVLNGHAGVKYGIPFPVLGRAAFGTKGIYLPSLLRALVACGWFGVQTWIGGLAIWSIWNAITGQEDTPGLNAGEFICFAIFWLMNMWFIVKGTESIKWLENLSAPFLILIGLLLMFWGAGAAGGWGVAIQKSTELQTPAAVLYTTTEPPQLIISSLTGADGQPRVKTFAILLSGAKTDTMPWQKYSPSGIGSDLKPIYFSGENAKGIQEGKINIKVQFRDQNGRIAEAAATLSKGTPGQPTATLWTYLLWLTAMMGFWATMSISISDITRLAKSQGDQIAGQFIGLPGTMIFYSFTGIFVTAAAVAAFDNILISDDAPWDPVALLARFENPLVLILAQFCMLVATLTTNIAANVVAPANVFSNLAPGKISFKTGGWITGLIGILICPWWLMGEISNLLVVVSAFLGPVVGILICDYFLVRKKQLNLQALYRHDGEYGYNGSGINPSAMIALLAGAALALAGNWIPVLEPLFQLAWFTGFFAAGLIYLVLMRKSSGAAQS